METTPASMADKCEALAGAAFAASQNHVAWILLRAAAEIDLLDTNLQRCWGGPLNGQVIRQQVLAEVIRSQTPAAIVETGTFRAITTAWFAQISTSPIYTCEAVPRFYLQSAIKLRPYAHVTVFNFDSRSFLRDLCTERLAGQSAFFYLDAHSTQDFPLGGELEIILSRKGSSIVVIDDFAVEGDPGYGFDDYGPGKRIDRAYLEPFRHRLAATMYPAAPSSHESGARRGMCVLASDEASRRALTDVRGLVPAG